MFELVLCFVAVHVCFHWLWALVGTHHISQINTIGKMSRLSLRSEMLIKCSRVGWRPPSPSRTPTHLDLLVIFIRFFLVWRECENKVLTEVCILFPWDRTPNACILSFTSIYGQCSELLLFAGADPELLLHGMSPILLSSVPSPSPSQEIKQH